MEQKLWSSSKVRTFLTNADGTLQFDRAMPIALLSLVVRKRREPLYMRTAEKEATLTKTRLLTDQRIRGFAGLGSTHPRETSARGVRLMNKDHSVTGFRKRKTKS